MQEDARPDDPPINLFSDAAWAQIREDWTFAFCSAFGLIEATCPRAVVDTLWGRQAAQVIAVVLQGATHPGADLDYTFRLLIAHDVEGLRGCVLPNTYAEAVAVGLQAMPADARSATIETASWLLGRVVGP